MGKGGNGVEYVDRNREERSGVEEEMGWNTSTETGRKYMGRRGNA